MSELPINDPSGEDSEMPAESTQRWSPRPAHIRSTAKVILPASIERSVWDTFREERSRSIGLSELLRDVLKRDIEINEALK